ncbi:MAG: LytTR family transcriptional regulator DNA-binding domain-containing protein [Bacteroidales bacterium]|nr:LytTR family transcriptional regulator DNA-binding domain-containing protein [Bacteroidales bacterium]
MNKGLYELIRLFRENLGLFLSISFGIFMFVLFFQPFPLERLDFNNRLLFVAGLGAIVFLFLVLVRIISPWLIQNSRRNSHEPVLLSFLGGFIIFTLNAVAFAFYLRYVGLVDISFHLMFRVVLICIAPPVILRVCDNIKQLKQQSESLVREKQSLLKRIEKYEEDYLNKSIEFVSEGSSESLNLMVADVVCIKSADNYVEVVYREGDGFNRTLLRNTLKNIEQQISPYSYFVRCHRTCIVNTHHIDKLEWSYHNHWLALKDYDDKIPVSRQYLLKIREILAG